MLEKYQSINRAHAKKRKGALTKEMLEKAKKLSKAPRTDSYESETAECVPAAENTQDEDAVDEEESKNKNVCLVLEELVRVFNSIKICIFLIKSLSSVRITTKKIN